MAGLAASKAGRSPNGWLQALGVVVVFVVLGPLLGWCILGIAKIAQNGLDSWSWIFFLGVWLIPLAYAAGIYSAAAAGLLMALALRYIRPVNVFTALAIGVLAVVVFGLLDWIGFFTAADFVGERTSRISWPIVVSIIGATLICWLIVRAMFGVPAQREVHP